MIFILLLISYAFMIAADIYDVIMTTEGIKAGVAVEGNTWLIGDKPTALQLYARDSLVMVFCLAPSVVAHFLGNDPIAYGGLVSPVIFGIKHIQGGLAWKKLLK